MANIGKLREIILGMPDAPGVYIMRNSQGEIIYVGKANSLKKRLYSYLSPSLPSKTVALMSNVESIEFKLSPTESLALFLEAGLIRRHKPKYNIALRDDKSFPFIKITNEEFPAICIARKRDPDGARYFGPYTSTTLLRDALKIIRKHFPYRSCKRLPKRPCIYFRIGLSPAPCAGKISKSAYGKILEDISLILEGNTDYLVKKLSRQMQGSAKEHNFEEAAKLRDQINALSAIGPSNTRPGNILELEGLKKIVEFKKIPLRIEAFDISNISGKEACGSMVSFYKGIADKSNYRRFLIKTVEGIDDYAMIREVVSRRYQRLIEHRLELPDLILIDGGRGHLLAAEEELRRLGLDIPLASIAKEKEHVYIKNNTAPVKFIADTPALNLIRRIRDEAHRFALSYHHLLRKKKLINNR